MDGSDVLPLSSASASAALDPSPVSSVSWLWLGTDILICIWMTRVFLLPSINKINWTGPNYAQTRNAFRWLASQWGMPNRPDLFRCLIGYSEFFLALLAPLNILYCFQICQFASLVAVTMMCGMYIPFLVTHLKSPMKKKLELLRDMGLCGVSIYIKLSNGLAGVSESPYFEMYMASIVGESTALCAFLYMYINAKDRTEPLLPRSQ